MKIRTFYVDTAKSIINKNNKAYWKCSVVENNKNILNFPNSKPKWSIEAEAYTILATIFWLKFQKERISIIIFTDALFLVKWFNKINKWNQEKLKNELILIKQSKKYKTRAYEFILLSRKISGEYNIHLTLKWIKGEKNPADYYSRN
jgi:hypothetical protein